MIYHTDGFTFEKNPSPLGGGYTICDGFGNLITTHSVFKEKFTSNEAELLGVYNALTMASNGDEIVTDSMNTVAWVRSGNPKARPDLKGIASTAKKIKKEKGITLTWKPREENWAGIYNEENYGA